MGTNGQEEIVSAFAPSTDDKSTKRKGTSVPMTDSSFSGPARVDDDMNYDDLRKLETIFDESSGEVGLNMEQFRVAMKKTMGYNIYDTELDMMFMKVDTNCDGTVDWDEYLSYMLLEYQEKENMIIINSDPPFPHHMEEKHSNHLESICRIALQQAYTIRNSGKVELDDSSSRYMTLSKEGVLNIWTVGWTLQKSTLIDGMRNNPRAVWFTDMVCMPNCNTVAVASTDYEISFYSMTSNMFQKKFQIRDMDCCALTLDYHFEYSDTRRSVLVWGDSSGSVFVLRFYDNPSLALFSSTSSSCTENKISLNNLVKNHIHNLRVARFLHIHSEWIRELHYYVNGKQQEFFISCCRSQQNSMLFADITEKLIGNANKKVELHRKSYFNVRDGVSCVAYDPDWNLIVTGSSDFNVRVWNPYVVTSSTMTLKGHVMPVQQVYVRMVDHHVISVSKDKNVRVWDLLDYSCKQSIHWRHVNLGRLDVTALYFHERQLQLVLGSNAIGVFVGSSSSASHKARKRGDAVSHTKPITKVLYNHLFKQLVTGSEDAMVSIWDLKTGEKTMQFCTDRGIEITAMAFDPTNRRLITGSRNGAISLWNFNNGALLRRLKTSDTLEVSAVLHAKNRIISAGWNKNVTVYHDSYTDESYRRMRMKHKDDILSMDYHKHENILGSSSYDGEICIWSLDVECVITKFNMYISILPIQETKHKLKPKENMISSISSSTTRAVQRNFTNLPSNLPWVESSRKVNEDEEDESIRDEDLDYESVRKTPSDKAVNKILFLQKRRSTNNIAILMAATAGYVVAWSVHQRGGILGYFSAVKHSGEMVVDMETDQTNSILITADSRGYIRVWKVCDYCNGADVMRQRNSNLQTTAFPNLFDGVDSKQAEAYRQQHAYVPMNHQPKLQTSFRGHCRAITSISFIRDAGLIASGSIDCSVRLWTINGRYIGTFGQQSHWNLELPINDSRLPVAIPNDVRRIASPTTLYSIKGGYHHQWKQVKNAVGFVGKARGVFDALRAKKEEVASEEDEIERRFSALSENLVKAARPGKRGSTGGRRDSVTFWMEDRPHSISSGLRKTTDADRMYERIKEHGITSKILGRINYKPKRRHKRSDIDTTIKWIDKSAMVYSTLPCSELNEPVQVTMPEYFQKKCAPPQQGATLSRYANKLIERRRIIHSFSKNQSSANIFQRTPKHSFVLELDDKGESEDTTSKSNSRASSGSSHKTKRVSFSDR